MTASELQGLVAPIALYPDALVAQILSAATFPDQVAIADNWLQTNKTLTGSALTQAVEAESWDPSVKALTNSHRCLTRWHKVWLGPHRWARHITTSKQM